MKPSALTRTRARRYTRLQNELAQARDQLRDAVLEELARGVTQAELARTTGWSREHLRKFALAATQEPEVERAVGKHTAG